ncbi:cancer-related nucleoside-triphosphatase homolog [Hyalella azteca]|uniref:Cancer-related nucleoside-triphosphatase homolog n=1 Tax=Hyalella azteca TaxID=294128 RepID=A0A8B7P028_HYAAZ|nr:cancer-related nucleoside-triphosphatase homolog [Hyalella azteca]
MSSLPVLPFIVITGPPGVGKTTLVCKLMKQLQEKQVSVAGFYTTEKRDTHGNRIGFNIVTTEGMTAPLAAIKSDGDGTRLPMIGRYAVDVVGFERVALPLMEKASSAGVAKASVFIVDEVGKMELLSDTFCRALASLLDQRRCALLLTIPVAGRGRPLPVVERIRGHPHALLVTLNRSNRNDAALHHRLLEALTPH